jgi:hypothetical protein
MFRHGVLLIENPWSIAASDVGIADSGNVRRATCWREVR